MDNHTRAATNCQKSKKRGACGQCRQCPTPSLQQVYWGKKGVLSFFRTPALLTAIERFDSSDTVDQQQGPVRFEQATSNIRAGQLQLYQKAGTPASHILLWGWGQGAVEGIDDMMVCRYFITHSSLQPVAS